MKLEQYTDDEIRSEYVERFGDPDGDVDLTRVKVQALIDELDDRDALPQRELHCINEIADLIAEAGRISPHAVRAYDLMREQIETMPMLRIRQVQIAGRMSEVA